MRCLYCGKELPLFKRLRGGEFCSDAHRQQYQEEYTQLALNRLLQANGTGESEAPKGKGGAASSKEAKAAPAAAKPLAEMESPALKRREKQTREEAPAPVLTPVAATAAKEAPPAEPVKKPIRTAASTEQKPQTAVLEPEPPRAPKKPPREPEPVPAPAPPPDEPAPAEAAGYLVAVPVAVMAEVPEISKQELELDSHPGPLLPRMLEFRVNENAAELPRAGRVRSARVTQIAESTAAPRERGLEIRDFVRSVPVVEINLPLAGELDLSRAEEPLELTFKHYSPSPSPRLWQFPDREFAPTGVVAGNFARLDFTTTGWSETALAESQAETQESAPAARVQAPVQAPVETAKPDVKPFAATFAPPAPVQNRIDPIRFEPARAEPASKKPVQFEPVKIDPVFMERITTPAVVETPAAKAPEPKREPAEPPIPEPITKPFPVTLHGMAPGRGKPVQVFSAALLRPAEIQLPVSTGLPLRPVMLLAPAPEAPAKIAAPAPAVPEKQESKPSNGKGRKPEVRVLSLHLREDGKKSTSKKEEEKPKQESKAEPRPEPKFEPKPEQSSAPAPVEPEKIPAAKPQPATITAKKAVEPEASASPAKRETKTNKIVPEPQASEPAKQSAPPESPKIESPKPVEKPKPVEMPKPVAEPMPELESLGLPKLAVEADGNFWSKLPAMARIGVAAGFLALVAGGIFLTSRGSSAPRTGAQPATEVGPPITDAGWATDWFTDGPASKANRHVDVLRGSLTLRDYRIEFEGQIERQAIGWVFRANNKNFYVEKIQIAGTGFEPPIELVKFAVVEGKEQPRQKIPLPFKVHLDTMYKVRTDVAGNHFTTWIQDQKVDDWTDARIDAGGVGLYYDNGDIPKLKNSINVMPLRSR